MGSSSPSAELIACPRPVHAVAADRRLRPQHDQPLKCPRCESTHTKFCYYNNYSLSQPRHFCKTCRRYWTKGGALRNVPVGGGCRKNKRSRSAAAAAAAAAAASSRLSLNLPVEGVGGDQQVAASAARLGFLGAGAAPVASSPIGGAPAADYQQAAGAVAHGPPCSWIHPLLAACRLARQAEKLE